MRHFLSTLLPLTLACMLGCSREPAPNPGKIVAGVGDGTKIQIGLPTDDKAKKPQGAGDPQPQPMNDPAVAPMETNNEKYEAALTEGLVQMADQKWAQALLSFETARSIIDTEFVRGEITKLRQRVEQDTAAKKTVGDIEKILEEGKASDAAKLAQQALKEFGDGDASAQLVKLRLQADALQNAGAKEDAAARAQRYREEGEAALREQNLRAAALAFEQALQARDDARLQDQLDDIRNKLQRYDGLRRRAAEMRRDPQQLEDALEALSDAAKLWDTLQVRQEIDECQLAMQKRRDNLSVADFEIRGNLGFPDAGRTIAEELQPYFKSRFELVERGQIGKVIQELKLEESFVDDPDQQRELARLAKVRYLVLGSVSRLSGVTVSARLVDARSGLVVQTGRITAPSIDEAIPLLPILAKQLLMSDQDKIAFDQEQTRVAKRIAPPADDAPLPPPPAAPLTGFVPPPIVVEVPAPPPFVGITIEHFRRLPPPLAVFVKLPPPPPPELLVSHRLLHASLFLGDDLFRRGRYAEAHRHFEFALSLSPGNFDLRLRLERVRPLLPPPMVIVEPVVILRPRIAILDFATFGDPRVVPPGLGPWTAYHLSPYFRARYDVVDPAEVYWWMGRLGISMRDLLDDPLARRWLARAVGVRYFVVGNLVATASFDVNTYVLDAEFGYLQSSASIHVRDPFELKLALGELAQLTMIDPVERARWLAEADRFNALVLRGRQNMDRRDFAIAIGIFDDALRLRPGHVEVMFHLTNCRRQADIFALEEARRQQYLRQQAFAAEAARRQWELARAAELARVRAGQEAALFGVADRRRLEEDRLRAHQSLLVQARVAIKTKNFTLALDFFKGAADIVPPQSVVVGFTPQSDIFREMALARAEVDRATQLRTAQTVAAREAVLLQQREQELARVRQRLAQEKQLVAETQKKALLERDNLLYQASLDEGQRLYAQGKYDAALSSLQAARRVKSTPAVEQLINLTLHQEALAKTKGAAERQQLELKLAAESARRKQAETETKRNQDAYQAALALANTALAQKQYAAAQAKYEEAGKLFQTDAVLTGLRRVGSARIDAAQKIQAATDKSAHVKQMLADGKSALDAKEYAKAVQAYQQAKKLAPDNLEVLAGLTQAEEARTRFQAAAQRQAVALSKRAQQFQDLLSAGKKSLDAKKYDDAVKTLSEAVTLMPDDKTGQALYRQAKNAQADARFADDVGKLARADKIKNLLSTSRAAMTKKDFNAAEKALTDAKKLEPNDPSVLQALRDLAAARQTADLAAQRDNDFQKAMRAGQKAMQAKNYKEAVLTYQQAAKIKPNDAQVTAQLEIAQRELRRAETTTKDEPKKKEEPKKKDDPKKKEEASAPPPTYQELIQSGQKALQAKKYDDAVKAFNDAQKLRPNDAGAAALLKQAQKLQGAADPKKKMSSLTPERRLEQPPLWRAVAIDLRTDLAGTSDQSLWSHRWMRRESAGLLSPPPNFMASPAG